MVGFFTSLLSTNFLSKSIFRAIKDTLYSYQWTNNLHRVESLLTLIKEGRKIYVRCGGRPLPKIRSGWHLDPTGDWWSWLSYTTYNVTQSRSGTQTLISFKDDVTVFRSEEKNLLSGTLLRTTVYTTSSVTPMSRDNSEVYRGRSRRYTGVVVLSGVYSWRVYSSKWDVLILPIMITSQRSSVIPYQSMCRRLLSLFTQGSKSYSVLRSGSWRAIIYNRGLKGQV